MKAIKLITFLLLMLYPAISEAQTKIAFSYDAAGNRVKREIILEKSSKANIDSTTSPSPNAVLEKIGEIKITIFPNPTLGQISIEITNNPLGVPEEIWIYNINGNMLQHLKTPETLSQIDLSYYPTGMYILRINIGGVIKEWKIVKK